MRPRCLADFRATDCTGLAMKLMDILLSGTAALALGIGACAMAQAAAAAMPGPVVARSPMASPRVSAGAQLPARSVGAPMAEASGAMSETTLPYAATGPVTTYRTSKEPARFVVFISGDGGWNLGVVDMARQLAHMDATVVGVDIRHYLRIAQSGRSATLYPAGDFASLALAVQKNLGFQHFHRPVVVGYSSGATLAYGALAQAPADTFQGAIGLGFCPDLKTDKPLAAGDGKLAHTTDPTLGFIYGPSRTLTAPFTALQGGQDGTCLPAATHAYMAQVPRGRVVDLPKVGHGYAVPANWAPQFAQAFASLYAATDGVRMRTTDTALDAHVADLPLAALPTAGGGDTLAVFYSGDGGWAGIDQGMSAGFVRAGIPVVGYDSLRYFWTARTPQGAAADLTAVLRHYMSAWHKSRIVLTGYSFGADALPAIIPHLPADLRSHIRGVALVGVDRTGELEFRPGDWLDLSGASAYPIAPALAGLKGTPLVCVYGDQESDAACPTFPPGVIRSVRLAGGHHYNGDFTAVSQAILKALPQ